MDKHSLELYVSTFTIALLHTMIPSHWLCFVAVGKAQGWRRGQTMFVAAVAGVIHVVTTVGLGLLAAWVGGRFLEHDLFERVSAWVLLGLGTLYLVLHFTRVGHHHEEDRKIPDRWALGALLLVVTASPCTAAIPMLVAVARPQTALAVVVIAGVLLVATVGSMVLLVGLTSLGFEKLQFRSFDRYEKLILGVLLLGLGAAIFFGAHGH